MKKNNSFNFGWLVFTIGLVAAIGFGLGPALAQEKGSGEEPFIMGEDYDDPDIPEEGDDNFGQNTQATWIDVWYFEPADDRNSESYAFSDRERCFYAGEPEAIFYSSFHLPSGARLQSARLWHYDGTSQFNRLTIYYAFPSSGQTTVCSASSSSPGQPFYDFGPNATCNHTIANGSRWYAAKVELGQGPGDGSAMCLLGVRLLWNRQVRTGLPNPFFDIGFLNARFQNAIKALAASGITTGCAPGQFCPSGLVTRGQMAVFLAEGLGLHWAYPTY